MVSRVYPRSRPGGRRRCILFVALISILRFSCFSLVAQEAKVVRVGVAALRSSANTVNGSEAGDYLAKILGRQKTGGKQAISLEAVALSASSERMTLVEAQNQSCDFVLYSSLTDLTTTTDATPLGDTLVPTYRATLEYRLNRVDDGSGFAAGSIKGEDPASFHDAIWHALSQVAAKVASEIKTGRGTPNAPAVTLPVAPAATPALVQPVHAPEYCKWLPSDTAHAEVLREACEFAISLPQKMPNFLCSQNTVRYRGSGPAPVDLVSATVRYEDGHETYSDVKLNGRPISIGLGLRSTGEFGGNLRAVFDRRNHALFEYAREGKLAGDAAWIFSYRVAEQKDPLWLLQAPSQVVAPPYSGELWVDQKDGAVLRFSSVAKEMPPTFPMNRVELLIDYRKVAFGDGTNFVLPAAFTLTNNYTGEETSRNVVEFQDCHKFGARTRIVLKSDLGSPGAGPGAEVLPDPTLLAKELAQMEEVFTAIGEQAMQQDAAQRELEQKQMLDAETASALNNLPVPRRRQPATSSQVHVAEEPTTPAPADALPSIKVDVNLVPVSVVLRDAKGQAVGGLVKENFRLFDEGKLQVITRFSVEAGARVPVEETARTAAPDHVGVHSTIDRGGPAAVERDTAYLFDDVHLSFGELAAAREAAAKHLGSLEATERAAIFSTSGAVVVDFTDDREKLLAGLRSVKPHSAIPENDCPPISHYMADLMLNKSDAEAGGLALAEARDCAGRTALPGLPDPHAQHLAASKAREVLEVGNIETKNSLAALGWVVRRTESLPGQRTIVLVSPGFLAATSDAEIDVMQIVNDALKSGIVINALDAGGLHAPAISGPGADPRFESDELQARSELMVEFASGTGGVFFHNNNDLDEGFRRTAAPPEFVYVLGFSPQKLDGKFHKLKVTLNDARFDVQARRGYYALKPKPAKQQAQ